MKFEFIKKPTILTHRGLQFRFLMRVLLPPFVILLLVSVAGFVILSNSVRQAEMANLKRATSTTVAKLEREFALRKTVLISTGEELFTLKSEFRQQTAKLKSDYAACQKYLLTSSDFTKSPDDSCKPFYAQFAVALQENSSLQAALNTAYVDENTLLASNEQEEVNKRLKEFLAFFPETSQLIITSEKEGVISRAGGSSSPTSDEYLQYIDDMAKQAMEEPVEAESMEEGSTRQMIFAYPIAQGSVLASYSLDNENFLYPSWESAPIDTKKAYLVIADTTSKAAYPNIKEKSLYQPAVFHRQDNGEANFESSGVEYLATTERIGDTRWIVIVASPAAIALESLANSQIIAVFIAGLLLVSFIWVGSIFIRRTVGSIMTLVGGAVIFSSGQLNHRIDTSNMSDREFGQLAETMNNMAIKIQEAEEAIDRKNKEFINVATHEIKAPITAIIGNLSMILDDGMGAIDDTARQLSTAAYKGTIRLRNLVNELLDIARLESGTAKFELETIDLNAEIKDMIDVQQTPANEKGIQVSYSSAGTPTQIVADKTKLEIILTNFISNGIKYNRDNGKLIISHEDKGDFIQINVQDTGLGIPADQQEKMFQKFFRVEGSDRSNIPGTGLGMFITKQFIEGMGGKLWFESEHGKGTVFHFTFPKPKN